jgi:hypothetical protein
VDASGANTPESPPPSGERDAAVPLSAAVRELFSGLRAGAADVADLVAAEAQVALRLLVSMVLSAVGAAVLAVLGIAGLAAGLATLLIEQGTPPSTAIIVVALLCVVGSVTLVLNLHGLARRVLFARSRTHLRGEHQR